MNSDLIHGYIKLLDMENPKTVADFATDTASPVDIKFAEDGSMNYLTCGTSRAIQFKVTHADVVVEVRAQAIRPRMTLRIGAMEILGVDQVRRLDRQLILVP